jgi:precorrin-6A synthase
LRPEELFEDQKQMRKLFIIGLGAGNPEYITVQAINALNQVDVFFVLDKGPAKADLLRFRSEICARYITDSAYRIVEIEDPVRDPAIASYTERVEVWHRARARLYRDRLASELGEDDCGAFLVWGDPALYDSSLRILEQIAARGDLAFSYEVIPGISSVQALAARHRISWNHIGGSVKITTGRKLAEQPEQTIENTLVMLDGECAFKHVPAQDLEIYWGAYLGSDAEILRAGKLSELREELEQLRAAAKAEHGWIMDTYLLRKPVAREP